MIDDETVSDKDGAYPQDVANQENVSDRDGANPQDGANQENVSGSDLKLPPLLRETHF